MLNFKKTVASMLLVAFAVTGLSACSTKPEDSNTLADNAKSQVMLYSSLKEDQLAALKAAFTAKHPDIQMDYYAAGTGKCLTKIAAEQQSGQIAADLIWVGDPSNYLKFKEQGMLEAYESKEAATISPKFKDSENYFVGARLVVLGFSYNSNLVQGEAIPKTWNDLAKADFKGQLVMSDPAEAGTTMYAVSALASNKNYGWEYFDKLKANGMELESGTSSTINKVGAGAYKVCIGVDYVTRTLEAQGSPIKFAYPEQDLVAVSSPIAILKQAPNKENAKLLYDFILSEEGQKCLSENKATPIRPNISVGEGSLDASEIADRSMTIDDAQIAAQKQEVLDKFDKLFK